MRIRRVSWADGFACAAAIVLGGGIIPGVVAGETQESGESEILRAFQGGTLGLGLRYRFEGVWDDSPAFGDSGGYASTLRTALSYRTAGFKGLSAFVEFENVADLGLGNEHNNLGAGDLGNGVTGRPGIADPEITEVNQVYLQYEGIAKTVVSLGRQEMSLADERFVGPVGWRQNHQSLDIVHVTQKSIPRTTIEYAYVENVNRIFGDNHLMASHLADVTVAISDRVTAATYAYYLDYEASSNAGLSTLTVGARGSGNLTVSETWRIPIRVEAAWQGDSGENPNEVDAVYTRLEAGFEGAGLALLAGYELLGGKSSEGAFATPLATLHKFNGWADKFLNTPPDGLQDIYFVAKGSLDGFTAILAFHLFDSDAGDASYGEELNGEINYKTTWKQTIAAKFALYNADQFSADTRKLWIYTGYAF